MIATDAHDKRLLGRTELVQTFVDDHIGDQKLLVPAGEVQKPGAHGAGIPLGKSEKLGDVVKGSRKLERLNVAVGHGLDQRPPSGDGGNKLDVFFGITPPVTRLSQARRERTGPAASSGRSSSAGHNPARPMPGIDPAAPTGIMK